MEDHMYSYIRGKLTSALPGVAIVETGGIGYQVFVPTNLTLSIGEEILLHTSYIVRETFVALYGFTTPADRDLFNTIINISGIGPKTGLGIMGSLHLLQQSAEQNSPGILAKIPGIGKKTAERLLIELKDKVSILPTQNSVERDATLALVNLGYPLAKAQRAVRRSLPEEDLSILIKEALNSLNLG